MRILSFLEKGSSALFFRMFGLVALLNINYALLRSARNALAVADLGGGAGMIPWFELLGTMPGAVLMTLCLSWMLNRFSIQRVFFVTLTFFVSFFLVFVLAVHPFLHAWEATILSTSWLPGKEMLAHFLPQLVSMLFFVMAELWKIALFTVLFWGMVNQYVPVEKAKAYYAPLMLGSSLGTILAGPIISFCTADVISNRSWSVSLILIMGALTGFSVLIAYLFRQLSDSLSSLERRKQEEKKTVSMWEGLRICFQSPYLLLLAWVTIADYVAYALGEVVFLDLLKQKFPDPRDYCDYMGKLSLWSGILTALSALVITPYLLRRCRWVVASLVTPICLLVTEGAFFFALWQPNMKGKLELFVLLGTLFFCLVRAAKYTLFDTSKEISFLLLPPLEKMQGKLVVDGMCARLGRGSGSCLSLILIQMFGSVLASVPAAGAIALGIAGSCVLATSRLGVLVEKKSAKPQKGIF